MVTNKKLKKELESIEISLRRSLSFCQNENIEIILAICNSLKEISNISNCESNSHSSLPTIKNELNSTPFTWNNTTQFIPASEVSE